MHKDAQSHAHANTCLSKGKLGQFDAAFPNDLGLKMHHKRIVHLQHHQGVSDQTASIQVISPPFFIWAAFFEGPGGIV